MGFAVVVVMIIAASVIAGCTNNMAVLAWDEPHIIHVAGKVLCQDCTQGWNEWISGGNPIKGIMLFLCDVSVSWTQNLLSVRNYTCFETIYKHKHS
ncbi:hypothetical protein S83_019550 [Arachis hypogaea]